VSARAPAAALLLAVLAGLAWHDDGDGRAHAQPQALTLEADARETGYIGFRLHSAPGLDVTISEGDVPLTTVRSTESVTSLRRLAQWRCDRRARTFTAASADGQTASAEIRTPSCARRLVLKAPRTVRSGRGVGLRLVDRWRLGGPERCRRERVGGGRRGEATRFRALRPGGWRVEARTRYGSAERIVRARNPGGRTRVYWLLLPTPRGGFFRETFPALNAGIRRSAARARRDGRVIDLVEVFTPGGRYRDSMPVGGREHRVRQGHGVHLNTPGASVAANVIIRTMRRERILR
jgi:hypothetical protein